MKVRVYAKNEQQWSIRLGKSRSSQQEGLRSSVRSSQQLMGQPISVTSSREQLRSQLMRTSKWGEHGQYEIRAVLGLGMCIESMAGEGAVMCGELQ